MATKKTTPELNVPENEDKKLEKVLEEQQKQIDAAKEVQELRKQLAEAQKQMLETREQLIEAQKLNAPHSRTTLLNDYDRVHKIEKETAESGANPWEVYVDVLVPHREKTEDPWYWININGRPAQIPANDEYQSIRLPWACALVDNLMYEKNLAKYQDQLQVRDPQTNPKPQK